MVDLKQLASTLPFDITAEALASLVMENDKEFLAEQFRIQGIRHASKVAGREITEVSFAGFNDKGRELVHMHVNRRSLFDALPEMLFHSGETLDTEMEQAQLIASERENARCFLIPFEEELYRTRIEVECSEHAFLKELSSQALTIYGWDLGTFPPEDQKQIKAFGFFLPFLNRIVGNLSLTCAVLTSVLNKTITVTEGRSAPYLLPASLQSRLGEASLGDLFVLGDVFSDGARQLDFSISGVEPAELEDWIPGGKKRILLEETFFVYLLAAGECYTITIILNNPQAILLGDDQCSNILGFATI